MSKVVLVTMLATVATVGLGWGVWEFSQRPPELVPVTGRVFYHGKPIGDGFVMSQPIRRGDAALGPLDQDGRFELRTNGIPGACVGDHHFVVKSYTRDVVPQPLIPDRYLDARRTPLRIQVVKGQPNYFEFHLTDSNGL